MCNTLLEDFYIRWWGASFVGLKGISSVISTQAISTVPQKKRGCVVDGEVQLNYFARYSQSACVAECATRKMQELCNCRPYFFRGFKTWQQFKDNLIIFLVSTFSFSQNSIELLFFTFDFQLTNQFRYVIWENIPASPRFMVGQFGMAIINRWKRIIGWIL